MDRLRDVLDPLWAEVPEAEIEFVLDAVKDDAGNARPARLRHLLQTRRNVHAVAVNVIPIDDDVAEVYSDPQLEPLFFGKIGVAIRHRSLNVGRALHRVDDAGELDQHPIAHQLDDASMMLRDRGVDDFFAVRLEPGERSRLVGAHETAVADDVGAENSGESAFLALRGHGSFPR